MIKATQKRSYSILFALGIFIMSFFFSVIQSHTASADAVTGSDKSQGIAQLTERWMRYRAIARCYNVRDVDSSTFGSIRVGSWFKIRFDSDPLTSIGYLNDDGQVSCGDTAFVTNSLSKIGFSSNLESYCSMWTARRGNLEVKKNDDTTINACISGDVEGDTDNFDMDGSRSDQVSAFKSAKAYKVADSADFPFEGEGTGKFRYWLGLQSLKHFCGGTRGRAYTDSMSGNVGAAKRQVVVNEVNLANSKVERYVYNLKEDDTKKFSYAGIDNDLSYAQLTCQDMAKLTWAYDESFSAFVSQYNRQNPDDTGDGLGSDDGTTGDDGEESTTSCAIDGIGWIICPVMSFMGKLNDAAFGFLNNFLQVEPKLLTDKDTQAAWSNFRDIANIAFVIVFLIIIYSQITGAGISNYGIKRMLPKLFVAAILVNISYFICQIAVDISNILGSSIYSMFKDMPTTDGETVGFGDGVSWEVVAGYILATAGALLVGVLALTTISTAALLAFALVILILIARKAILVLLVVVAPLAFVAYLLPNTEQWFKRWWKMFTTLLMVFPVVAVIFGASTLAARIINNSAGGETVDGGDQYLLQLTALGIMAIPLFAVPAVLKGALSAAGSVGGKLAGWQDRANRGAMDKAKSGRFGEAKAAFAARSRANRVSRRLNGGFVGKGRVGRRVAEYGEARGGFVGKALQIAGAPGKSIDESRFANYLGADKGAASAVYEQNKLNNEAIERSIALLENDDAGATIENARRQLQTANKRGDAIGARAAVRLLATKTGSRGVEVLHKEVASIESSPGGIHNGIDESIRHEVNGAGLKGKDRSLDKWSRAEPTVSGGPKVTTLSGHDNANSTPSGLNEQELAGQSLASLRHFAATGTLDAATAKRVLDAHATGNISLDGEKLDAFNQAVAGTASTQAGWKR